MHEERSNIELAAILNTLVDSVVIINGQGIIQLFTPASEEMFGYISDEVVGKNVKCLMPESYAVAHDGYLQNYLTTGHKRIIGIGREVTGLRKDGSEFPMDLSVGETQLNGSPIFIGVIKDLTARHEAKRQYDVLQDQHYHLARVAAMNEMGSALAHELNQPLAASITYIDTAKLILESDSLEIGKLREILDFAQQQSLRASDIINRMRSFVERGEVEKKPKEVELLINSSLDLGFPELKSRGIDLELGIASDLPKVMASKVQIQQVIVNLVRNACEAMEESETKVLTLSAYLSDCGKYIEVSVADTGHGLLEEDRARLFVPFASKKKRGMGVGLSISQSIVSQHGGQLWVRENKPVGAVFHFTLPLA